VRAVGLLTSLVTFLVSLQLAFYFDNTSGAYQFLLNNWYFDEMYEAAIVVPAHKVGDRLWHQGDEKIIDGYGPDGIAQRVMQIASRVSQAQSGYVYHYALAFMLGFLGLILWIWIV